MNKKNIINFFLAAFLITHTFAEHVQASAKNDYTELNNQAPLAISVGFAMSQTHETTNTVHPEYVRAALITQAAKSDNPIKWHCEHENFIRANSTKSFDEKHQNALIKQIENLGAFDQSACKINNLPTCRISIEIADILADGTQEIDSKKLKLQSDFLQKFKNPFIFCHHYTNSYINPNALQTKESIPWFANCCAQIAEHNPNITHICPISQPVGYSFHLQRATLPPFSCSVDQKTHLQIIKEAQIAASRAIKAKNPNIKVLMSHQWKCFKPMHGKLNPWYALEYICCCAANYMYNQAFVSMLCDCQNDFDGIALSIYPGIAFNGIKPEGNNCCDSFNEEDAYNSIIYTHNAFPNKEIFIVETGCNSPNPETKKAFIDMTLRVCKRARAANVKISGIYFWGVTNDPEFYFEWGKPQGTTHFGPYDQLNPDNPCDSINAGGLYLKEILQQ